MSIDDLLEAAMANSARLFELAAAVLMSRDPAEIDRLSAEINARAVKAVALQVRLASVAELMTFKAGTVH